MKKKSKFWVYSLLIMSAFLIITSSCEKDDIDDTGQIPVLTTTDVSSITHSTASSGGNITSDGGLNVTARGVCWSTSQSPTVADSKTNDGSGTGSFTSSISGLSANKTYYVRAYATNDEGTVYGSQLSFKTSNAPSNSMSATIDGVPYTASSINVSSMGGKIAISGMNGSKNLLIWLPSNPTTGSHSFSLMGDYMGQFAPTSTTIFTSSSGTINISEYNSTTGKIKATFNFVGSDFSTTIDVTNGQLEVYK